MSLLVETKIAPVGNRLGAVRAAAVALIAPLFVGAALMFAALSLGVRGNVMDAAQYAGALAVCLALTFRRREDRALLHMPAWRGVLQGTVAGALRAGIWLIVLPTQRISLNEGVAVGIAIQVLLVAPAEELQFRGLLLSRIQEAWRPAGAIVVSAAVFTALHSYSSALIVLPAVAADALLFTALRCRYKTVGPSILAHAMFNAVTLAMPANDSLSSTSVLVYVAAVVITDAALAIGILRLDRRSLQ